MTTWTKFVAAFKPSTDALLAQLPDVEVPRQGETVVLLTHSGGTDYRVSRVWWEVGERTTIANVELVEITTSDPTPML